MKTQIIDDRSAYVMNYFKKGRELKPGPEKEEIKRSIQHVMPKALSNGTLSNDMVLSRGEVLTLAHEIKNPLTNIVLSMSYLNHEITDPDLLIYFEIINRSTKRINDLVNGLLVNSAHEFAKEICSLNDAVSETLELALDRITLKKVTIQKKFTSEKCLVEIDKPRFKIALLNIIVNAIEAMKTGVGHLALATEVHNDKCLIIIKDNGGGIKQENISRLFDPYYTSKNTGTGIGLAVAKQVFDCHNSIMEVRSEEGKGTIFTISLNTVEHG